jgi:serine/threonine protein kinase/DNA-binding winged helix-turn-helix (wHTH) protein
MNPNGLIGEVPEVSGALWLFGQGELDELRRELRVKGQAVELESKPLEVLLHLLRHAGEVVTKEELLESVWPGLLVVDGSLATAVSKLRRAIGDEDQSTILTVSRVGYRLAVPVQCKTRTIPRWTELGLRAGEAVPGREHWWLVRPLDSSGSSDAWLGEHPKTHELRVFKFASDGVRLTGLKREVTVSRFLHESLGDRPEFVRALEWNFEAPPFFIESEYSGQNLSEWAEGQGGLKQIPFAERLRILMEIADAVAAAHGVGVLHKDLKPENVLASPKTDGGWQIKVTDFGSASLMEPSRLRALGITNLGFTKTGSPDSQALTGTLMYMAPEVLAGHSPTASGDVYALGVMLYQIAVGDFRKPLSPGWEADIEDALIREDIAEAAHGDPVKRLNGAAGLAERLRTLDLRRVKRNELELAKERAQIAEKKLAAARARRPWVVVAATALLIGFVMTLNLSIKASRERDHANRQTAIAGAINQFLSDDLLGRNNPFQSGQAAESLLDAVKRASPNIDRQFKDEPQIAARLHHTIARALDSRTNYPDARHEYQLAAELYDRLEGPLSQEAIVVRLQRSAMEARSYEAGSMTLAKTLLNEQETLLAKIPKPRADMPVWISSARGMIALVENNAKSASENFGAALEKAATLPDFDESARLTLKQRLAFAQIRLGDGQKAEQLFKELIEEFSRLTGPDSANVLRVRLNLAQAYMIQNKHVEAVRETNAIYPGFVARFGIEHELTMQLLTTRAQSEGGLEMWDDAIRDDLAIYKLAVQKQGPLSFFAIAPLSDGALAQCRAGRYAEGEANARRAYQSSSNAFGERAGLTGGTASTLAGCLIGLGKLDEATKLLDNIDIKVVSQLAGDPDWGAEVTLLQADIAFRRGDYATARKAVEAVTPVFTRVNAEAFQKHSLQALSAALDKRAPKNQ